MKTLKKVIFVIVAIIFFITDIFALMEADRLGLLAMLLVGVVPVGNFVYLQKRRPIKKKYFDIKETNVSDNAEMSNKQGVLSIISWSAFALAIVSAVLATFHGRIGLPVTVAMLIIHVVTSWAGRPR